MTQLLNVMHHVEWPDFFEQLDAKTINPCDQKLQNPGLQARHARATHQDICRLSRGEGENGSDEVHTCLTDQSEYEHRESALHIAWLVTPCICRDDLRAIPTLGLFLGAYLVVIV